MILRMLKQLHNKRCTRSAQDFSKLILISYLGYVKKTIQNVTGEFYSAFSGFHIDYL